jgi:hypothetical protein
MVRIRAGISYALTEAMDEGHCGLPTAELGPMAETLLEVPEALVGTALQLELHEGTVVADRVGDTNLRAALGTGRRSGTGARMLAPVRGGASAPVVPHAIHSMRAEATISANDSDEGGPDPGGSGGICGIGAALWVGPRARPFVSTTRPARIVC